MGLDHPNHVDRATVFAFMPRAALELTNTLELLRILTPSVIRRGTLIREIGPALPSWKPLPVNCGDRNEDALRGHDGLYFRIREESPMLKNK